MKSQLMKTKKEIAYERADEFQILLYNAKDPYAIEVALDDAMSQASDLFYKTPAGAKGTNLERHVNIEAIKILEDTIARLQKVTNMAKRDGRILWRFSK